MNLLFQVDDYGITKAVTLGILEGIENGLVRNTGLFVNMPSSEFAASKIKNYPDVCFGLDINLVAGKPVSDAKKVKSLVDSEGKFISSVSHFSNNKIIGRDGLSTQFEIDPFNLDETLIEVENQVKKYIELVGEKPPYIHPHSLMTPNTLKAIRTMAKKYNIPFSMDFLKHNGFVSIPGFWNIKPVFTVGQQEITNVEANVINEINNLGSDVKNALLICHAGYVDSDLMDVSTYTLIRAKDLQMATSEKLKNLLDEKNIKLITYKDVV